MSIYSGYVSQLLGLTPQQVAALESNNGISQFQIADSAANIEALTPQQIATLETIPVDQISAIDNSVSLSAAQAVALEAGNVDVTVPPGDSVTLVDSVANLRGLTSAQTSGLAAIGVTAVTAEDTAAHILSLGSSDPTLAAINAAIGGSGQPSYVVVDTAEDILPDLSSLNSNAAISAIDVTDSFNPTSTMSIGAGSMLELSDGSTSFGGTISGAGALQMESGNFQLNSNLQLSTGTWGIADLNGSDNANVNLAANLSYGGTFLDGFNGIINLDGHSLTLSGSDAMLDGWVYGPTGSLVVSGTADANSFIVADSVVLEDKGSLTQSNYLVLGLNQGDAAELKIDAGANYLLQGASIFDGTNFGNGGTTLINNAGTFEVANAGGQSSDIFAAMKTSGTLAVDSGASLELSNATLTNDGLVTVGTGASLDVADTVNADTGSAGKFVIGTDATVEFGASVASNQTVIFASDGTGVARLDDLAAFNGAIKGLQVGDMIAISPAGLGGFSTITSATPGAYDAATGTTSVVLADNGNTVATLQFDGNYSSNSFSVAANGGALDLSDPTATTFACYCRGTLIRTERGEVTVEDLAIGDKVMTVSGRARPIKWIGRSNVVTRLCDPLRAWPVRIKAHALAEAVPSRDLLVSPDHALLIDDVLIQAGALVNGNSIVRETNVAETITYFHIELEDHELIFAEDAPAETFVDNVDRLSFDNWAEHERLYPTGNAIAEMPYPRVKAHRQVPRSIRERLTERCVQLFSKAALPEVDVAYCAMAVRNDLTRHRAA
jgi:Hint domain